MDNEIKTQIDGLLKAFWANGISNPLSAIEQISYLLFIKRLDGVINFPEDKQYLRWSNLKNLAPETLFCVVRDELFPLIKGFGQNSYSRHLKDAVFLINSPTLLVSAIARIDKIPMDDQDIEGDAFEYILSKLSTAGINGQFRTPRHIVDAIVELLKPTPEDVICDPACGTAGFLVSSAKYIQRLKDDNGNPVLNDPKNLEHFSDRMFHGFDIDATMLRIGSMNMILHGVDHANIEYRNPLSDYADLEGKFSLILANPPFGGSVEKTAIAEDLISTVNSTKTEVLFTSLILRLLKVGGRCAIILPVGMLFNSSKAYKSIRTMLVEDCKLEAIVFLPSGVFNPYTSISTAIFIVTKVEATECATDFVWFYDMESDGFSLDSKRKAIADNDIPDLLQCWHSRSPIIDTDRTSQSFFVSREEIRAKDYNLSLDQYREKEAEAAIDKSPREILQEMRSLDDMIHQCLNELEAMLT